MTRVITEREYITAIRKVIADRGPNYIYDKPGGRCVYSDDEGRTGSCLHGVVLFEHLGLPWSDDIEGQPIHALLRDGTLWFPGVEFDVSGALVHACSEAQASQDGDMDYGYVGDEFELVLARGKMLAADRASQDGTV